MNDKATDKRPAFFMVEDAVIENFELTPYEGWIYIAILKYANRKTGEAFPGIATLAKVTRMSKSQVMRGIATLEKKCLIRVVRDNKPFEGEKRKREVNHYFILSASSSVSQEVGVVSGGEYPSVSQEVGVVSGRNKNQSEPEPELNNKNTRKRLPFPVKFPSNTNAYTAVHIEAYHKQFAETIDALVAAWYTDKMFKSITEMPLIDARKFIQPHKEILRFNIPITEYPALIKVARKEGAWRDNGATPADIQSAITPYLKTSKKIIYDDPNMDLSIPQPTTPILLQRKEE